jgi:class 3 adenylate cyclase
VTASWPRSTRLGEPSSAPWPPGQAVRAIGLEIRAGLHTGEIELTGEDVQGLAVPIGARIAALAGPGEVLVSSTVKDLVVGSGIDFDDRACTS